MLQYVSNLTSPCEESEIISWLVLTKMLYCPGCGFGFWHNWGVLVGMQPRESLITVSGSSLAAVCFLCRLDPDAELVKCEKMRYAMLLRPKATLRAWLHGSLPEHCAHICKGRLTVLVRSLPSGRVVRFDEWGSKQDLIECLIASASVLCLHKYREHWYTDCIWVANDFPRIPSKTVLRVPTLEDAKRDFQQGMKIGQHL